MALTTQSVTGSLAAGVASPTLIVTYKPGAMLAQSRLATARTSASPTFTACSFLLTPTHATNWSPPNLVQNWSRKAVAKRASTVKTQQLKRVVCLREPRHFQPTVFNVTHGMFAGRQMVRPNKLGARRWQDRGAAHTLLIPQSPPLCDEALILRHDCLRSNASAQRRGVFASAGGRC